MLTFVHTADWQLGMRRHYLDPEAQGVFSQARVDAVKAVGALAAEVDADFVTVGGDAFDDNAVDRRTVLKAREALASFPAVPVLVLPGNHDALEAGSVFRRHEFESGLPPNVRVVSDTAPIEVPPGVEVVGGPFTVRHPATNPLIRAVEGLTPSSQLRILLGHGNLDAVAGSFDQAGLLRLSELEGWLSEGLAHFVALGDRHSATSVGDTDRVWYAGAPEPTGYREDPQGTALVVRIDQQDVEVEVHRVGTWTYRQRVFDVAGPADLDAVVQWLDEPERKEHTIASLAVRGSLSLGDLHRLETAIDDARGLYGALEIWDRHHELMAVPSEEDLADMALGGFVAGALEELRDAAGRSPDDRASTDALALLHRLAVRA